MRQTVTVTETTYRNYAFRVRYPGGSGKEKSSFFTTETKANKFAKEKRKELGQQGIAFGTVETGEKQALEVWRTFQKENADTNPPDLLTIVQDFTQKWKNERSTVTIESAVQQFLEQKQAEGDSPSHIQSLKTRCERFANDFAGRKLSTIKTPEISKWVMSLKNARDGKPSSPTTKRNHRLAVSNLFTYAESENWVNSNPATDARKPKKPDFTPQIITPAQTKKFLHAVQLAAPETLPYWSVRIFAGLRASEAQQLTWEMIDLARNEIKLPGRITKTKRPRTVEIQPALKAFLKLHKEKTGKLYQFSEYVFREKMKTVRETLPKGFKLPENFARHGFGTYHALKFRHAGETAMQMGHSGDPDILFNHYTAEATETAAKAFWNTRPLKSA